MSKAIVRHPAPHFKNTAWYKGDFVEIDLNAYKGKYVVLFFYPLDFTFVCPTQIIAFSNKAAEFRAENCQVLGCSIDSRFVHMEWTKKPRKQGGLGQMDIPLLADVDKSIARNYGCLIQQGEDSGVAFRATYIIDHKGVLRHISINDLPVGRNPDETLRLVKAFQHSDKHGEVCPVNWNTGSKTLEPKLHSTKNNEVFGELSGGH